IPSWLDQPEGERTGSVRVRVKSLPEASVRDQIDKGATETGGRRVPDDARDAHEVVGAEAVSLRARGQRKADAEQENSSHHATSRPFRSIAGKGSFRWERRMEHCDSRSAASIAHLRRAGV